MIGIEIVEEKEVEEDNQGGLIAEKGKGVEVEAETSAEAEEEIMMIEK